MPPEAKQLEELTDFATSSWGLWSATFANAGCLEENTIDILPFMRQMIAHLNCSVVLLGHNRAPGNNAPWHPFCNFHSVGQVGDSNLKLFIQGNNLANLSGAYMTDLSQQIAPHGVRVHPNQQDFDTLLAQFNILTALPGPNELTIVCLGRDTFNELMPFLGLHHRNAQNVNAGVWHLAAAFNGLQLNMFSVNHFSPNQFNRRHVDELPIQLEFINQQL